MNRILPAVICLCMLICSVPTFAQEEGGSGIVYGSELGVLVTAPEGWIFDSKSGESQGLHAVMYPKGSNWSNANAMMYVNIVISTESSIEAFIAEDVANFRKNSPKIVVEREEPISISGGALAKVRLYSGDKWGNYECVAYAAKDKSVAIYVLSSRNKEGLLKSIDAFRIMVSKSALMHVNIPKKNI